MIISLIFSVNAVITTPYLWYNMENSSFQDELNNINLSDFSSTNISGVIGSGRDFESGSSQYASKPVTTAMTNENETWSISMWVKPESFAGTGYAGIFLIGNTANFARLGVTVNSAGNILIAGGTGTADTKVNTGVSISAGSWHHLVIVHNSNLTNGTYLYINGTNRANATVPNPTIGSDNNVTLSRWIGGGGATNYYDGSMDLVGYWDTTLTSAEVSELWNSSAGVAYPFSTPTPVLSFTSISLVNNTYTGNSYININTSVLNTSTNGLVNQTYFLYSNAGILINSTQFATNTLNSSFNLTLTGLSDQLSYKISFYATNGITNVSAGNYTFTKDTANPTINNNILSEYNYYNISGFNSSCTDLALLSCNISINSQNKALNTTTFNFTQNGNFSYNITAIDLAGNTATSSGIILINPYAYFYFNSSSGLLSNYTFTNQSINGQYANFTIYNDVLSLGSNTFLFEKLGYATTNVTFTVNTTSNINLTTNITQSKIVVNIYDRETEQYITTGTSLVSLVATTGYNTSTTTGQVNISDINFINEEYQLLVSNTNYYSENVYFTYSNQELLTVNLYLIATNSTDIGYVTVKAINFGDEALINGAYCYALEWKPSQSAFITVASGKTNVNGETILNIELASKLYKFSCSKDGTTAYTDSQIIQSTGTIIPIIMGSSTISFVPEFNNLVANLTNTTINSTHQRIRFSWNDENNIVTQGCINIYHSIINGYQLNDTICVSSTNSFIVEDININNTYNIRVDGYLNYQNTTINIDSLPFKGNSSLAKAFQTYHLDIVLPLVFFVLGFSIGLMIKPQILLIGFVGGIIGSWFSLAIVPSIVSISLVLFINVILGTLIWATWRPK